MKRWLKRSLIILGFVGCAIMGRAYWVFGIEEQIHGSFFPVVRAIERYCEDHGEAPPDLTALKPKYLAQVPSSDLVSGVSYSASPEERRWRLTLASAKTGKRRLYIAENGMPLSKAEMAQRTHQYHGTWSVIEPE